jgi:hypothetical protein
MVADNYPDGYDVVWLASDRLGQLAAFITAGVGPIPIWALDYPELSILDIEDSICGLPKSSNSLERIFSEINRSLWKKAFHVNSGKSLADLPCDFRCGKEAIKVVEHRSCRCACYWYYSGKTVCGLLSFGRHEIVYQFPDKVC